MKFFKFKCLNNKENEPLYDIDCTDWPVIRDVKPKDNSESSNKDLTKIETSI